jgi:hypothetical protein
MHAACKQELGHVMEHLLKQVPKGQQKEIVTALEALNRRARTWGQIKLSDRESRSGKKLEVRRLCLLKPRHPWYGMSHKQS